MSVSHQPVPFAQAGDYVLTFGACAGRSIREVAKTERGLRYLVWLRSIRLDFHTKNAVCSFLDDPFTQKTLAILDAANLEAVK